MMDHPAVSSILTYSSRFFLSFVLSFVRSHFPTSIRSLCGMTNDCVLRLLRARRLYDFTCRVADRCSRAFTLKPS